MVDVRGSAFDLERGDRNRGLGLGSDGVGLGDVGTGGGALSLIRISVA